MFVRLLPAGVALVLLAAHFLRIPNMPLTLLTLACIGLLFVRKPWAALVVQVLLGTGVVVWILTGYGIAMARLYVGEPWLRAAAIIGAVALFTLWAAIRFCKPDVRAWFNPGRTSAAQGT